MLKQICIALALATCQAASQAATADSIVEVASGRSLTRAELLTLMRASDYVLLGELHDNPHHHARRGELLAALGPPASVVAEHLYSGKRVSFDGQDLQANLANAGFEAKGWQWPLHEPLFAGVARAALPLAGGNIARDLARRIAREGEAALPAELAAAIHAAPLATEAQAALAADLVRGHCGQLAGTRLAGMAWAQRARDASMALALRAAETKPAVLLAGNGHVRLDYGVPQLLATADARLISVGFAEPGTAWVGAPYTHLWITPAAQRDDPCSTLVMPKG